MTSYHVSPEGQECEGISQQSFSVCNAVLTNHNYGETAVNGYDKHAVLLVSYLCLAKQLKGQHSCFYL